MVDLEKLDLRVRNRYLRKGLINQKEVDQYLESVPDVSENAEFIDYEDLFQEQDRVQAEVPVKAPEARPPEPRREPVAPPIAAAPSPVAAPRPASVAPVPSPY